MDELLDARFDDAGRLAHLGRDNRQRIAERLDPRPSQTSADELDLAVQKLSEGLEAIERQSRAARPSDAPSIRPETLDAPLAEPSEAGGRDFVTYSLDRLEARLEALSRRLQQRAGGGAGGSVAAPSPSARRAVPAWSEAEEEDRAAQPAESRRLAEAQEARRAATEAADKARQAEAAAEARLEAERARSEAEQARREVEQARREAEALAEEERRREIEAAAEIADAKREAEMADARRRSEVAEVRRQAELVEAKRQAEVTEARRQAELAEARRQADAQEARRQVEAAEARRRAEAEAAAEDRRRVAEEAEAIRLADLAEARRNAEAAEARHRAETEEARRRLAEEAEAIRLADLAEARRNAEAAEARHRAETEEVRRQADEMRRQAEISAARREAEMAARIERQFGEIETRIDGLQIGLDENQIEPVRGELLELVQQISELSRGGRATTGALDEIGIRLDQMEVKLNAARNMAGNRLGDIQDKLSGLVERLDEIEVEIPGFDAIRVNQSAILERFDRMEGLVTHIASPEELFERVDGLKRQMQTVASQREVARIEERILRLTERLDALPDDLSDKVALGRIEEQLGGLATEFMEARRQRKSVANELEDHLSELSAQLRDVAETGRAPDLAGLEERVSSLTARVVDDRTATGETLGRLEQRLAALTDAIESQEDDATKILARLETRLGTLTDAIENQEDGAEKALLEGLTVKLDSIAIAIENQEDGAEKALLENLTVKLDSLADAIDAQDSPGARRDVEGLGRRLDQLSTDISGQTEHLSRQQLEPLAERLEAIEDRIATLSSRAPDPRALQTQIEGIVSRLELLKGRSIDPARLNDLFDRVDAAVRAIPEDRFERLEQRLDDVIAPAERFDRLEKKVAEAAASAATGDRFTALERKLDDISRIFTAGGELLTQEDLTELRSDIVALRRELRSGLGQGDANLGELLRTLVARLDQLPQETPVTAADLDAQMERIARILDDPSQGRSGLVHIETSLKAIEHRLEETRRALERSNLEGDEAAAAGAKMESVAGLARALSDDVTVLKSSSQATEKKTRDAIDAVQDTLEAVVKRMAFLERDSDASTATAERGSASARIAPLPEISEPETEPEALEAPEAVAPDEPRVARDLSDLTAGGLLSRLTSRQLLKRATGGRAESFTPEAEESDDASDFPLEPGTDAPLSSALTGAPSSNTEFMSGARKGRLTRPFVAEDQHRPIGRNESPATVDDDFLAAARRAARAAAQDVSDDDGGEPVEQRPSGFFRRYRRSLLGVAIAAALIIAAIPLLRPQLWPTKTDIASLPAPTEPAAEPETAAAPEASTSTPSKPETSTASSSEPGETPPPAVAPEMSSEATPSAASSPDLPQEESATATQTTESETPAEAAPEPSTRPGTDVAAVTPSTTPEASTPPAAASPDTAAAAPGTATTLSPTVGGQPLNLPPLPDSIGSAKLRDAAMAGDNAAAFEVAARYAEGRGVLPDMTTSVLWYLKAAEAGLAPAQYRLASIYEKGLGVPKDLGAAQKWYGRAAEAGNVKAMHNLAVLFAEGAGGTPDLERASTLFRQAAERGVRDSQFNLAILHARGLGVPQDLVEAYKWFGIAASSGDEESAKRRDIIGEALSASDKEQAEQAIATFQPAPLISEANEVVMPDGGWSDSGNSTSVDLRDQDALVALVQKLLAENGYDPGPADGKLGSKTIDAITAFQTKAGLPKTGKIDTGLVAALQDPTT